MTPEVIHGLEALSVLFLIVWNIGLEIRLSDVRAELNEQRYETSKLRIQSRTKLLTDPELDALLDNRTGGPIRADKKD